jgi:hypothetical protein
MLQLADEVRDLFEERKVLAHHLGIRGHSHCRFAPVLIRTCSNTDTRSMR